MTNANGMGHIYQFTYDSKDFLFWDAEGNGYANNSTFSFDDVIVEITGANNLGDSNIYLYAPV